MGAILLKIEKKKHICRGCCNSADVPVKFYIGKKKYNMKFA
jgi:hypothetical protein